MTVIYTHFRGDPMKLKKHDLKLFHRIALQGQIFEVYQSSIIFLFHVAPQTRMILNLTHFAQKPTGKDLSMTLYKIEVNSIVFSQIVCKMGFTTDVPLE